MRACSTGKAFAQIGRAIHDDKKGTGARSTADPAWVVQWRRYTATTEGYADGYVWTDDDGDVGARSWDGDVQRGDSGWSQRDPAKDVWVPLDEDRKVGVETCWSAIPESISLTKDGALGWLKRHSHDYKGTPLRLYCMSLHDSPLREVRELLLQASRDESGPET